MNLLRKIVLSLLLSSILTFLIKEEYLPLHSSTSGMLITIRNDEEALFSIIFCGAIIFAFLNGNLVLYRSSKKTTKENLEGKKDI